MGGDCEASVLAVFDTRGVLDVLESPQGLLGSGHRVRGVLECSTGSPDALELLANRLQARGVDYVESPLSGASEQIGAGEAVALLGGEGDAIARHADLV